jgi:hypothetical protein
MTRKKKRTARDYTQNVVMRLYEDDYAKLPGGPHGPQRRLDCPSGPLGVVLYLS